MQILDNKALLLRLKNPNKVTKVVEKSRELSDNQVVVNWGVDEAHTLKKLNINVPSPIEGKYRWSGQVQTIRTPKDDSRIPYYEPKGFLL